MRAADQKPALIVLLRQREIGIDRPPGSHVMPAGPGQDDTGYEQQAVTHRFITESRHEQVADQAGQWRPDGQPDDVDDQ